LLISISSVDRDTGTGRLGACFAAVLAAGFSLACGSVATTHAASLTLLDDRGWEMVSPVGKNGGEVQGFGAIAGGGVLQAAADGESATFSSISSFGAGAKGAPVASQYISRRGPSGWSTENVTLPTFSGAYGEEPVGVPYRLFSDDLARGLILDGRRCDEGEECLRSYALRVSAGGGLTLSPEEPDLLFAGTSPDLRHVILSTCVALTPAATEIPEGGGCDPDTPNLYDWNGGQLRLINLLPHVLATSGAALAAPAGAVSSDASHVYWRDLESGSLMLAEESVTKQVDDEAGTGGSFEAATLDGSIALLVAAGHLHRYSAVTDSSTDLTPAGGVLGVLGASEDAVHVYYQSSAGLQLWHAGTTTQIAPGAAAADPGNYPPATGTARVSADGTRLVFVSTAPLTGYHNTDKNTGEPDSEVFLYDATANGGAGALTCVSCNPANVQPVGPSSIPGAIANGKGPAATLAYKPRALAAVGRRVFFDSEDALVTGDTNNDGDVYEWEAQGTGSCTTPGGCLELISSGRSEDGASFVDASGDGSDVFFLTDGSLVPSDPGAVDLYDARAGGGFPEPDKPIPCEGDACQPLPSPPEDPTPGTLVPTGGNPPVRFPPIACPGGKRPVVRNGRRRCAPKRHQNRKRHGKAHRGGGRR
jgi:hypothetical protein